MKTLKLIALGLTIMLAGAVQGQISVNIRVHATPPWGPTVYSGTRYYYLPDVEAYYDIPNAMFIYYNGRNWIHRKHLPGRFRHYDLYRGYKVVMNDYRGNTPYFNHNYYRERYSRVYRGTDMRYRDERHDSRRYDNDYHSKGKADKHYKNDYDEHRDNRR